MSTKIANPASSNERRRAVITILNSADVDSLSLSELVDHVAEHEQNTPLENISSQERNRVYVSLYQTHLPKLDENDIVRYNKEDKKSLEQSTQRSLMSY